MAIRNRGEPRFSQPSEMLIRVMAGRRGSSAKTRPKPAEILDFGVQEPRSGHMAVTRGSLDHGAGTETRLWRNSPVGLIFGRWENRLNIGTTRNRPPSWRP